MTFPLRPYPWQGDVWSALRRRVAQGRLAHALLFTGPQGLGKKDLATAFAQSLLCETPHEAGACGQCRSCRLFEAGTHPDFLLLEPEEEGKDLTIAQIRGLAEYQALRPHCAAHKVVLLVPAERMNSNAANALLKTLEEPTGATLLTLVTDRPTGLLPTIRSRCQSVTFVAPAATPEVVAWVAQQSGLSADEAVSLMAIANNAPRRAVALAREGAGTREGVWNGLLQTAKGDASPSEVAARWQELGADKAFGWAHAALCELIRSRSTGDFASLEAARLQPLVKPIDLVAMFRLLDRAQEAGRLLRGHVNAQLLIEEFLIHWSALFPRRAAR